jgi:hypothetical protein
MNIIDADLIEHKNVLDKIMSLISENNKEKNCFYEGLVPEVVVKYLVQNKYVIEQRTTGIQLFWDKRTRQIKELKDVLQKIRESRSITPLGGIDEELCDIIRTKMLSIDGKAFDLRYKMVGKAITVINQLLVDM